MDIFNLLTMIGGLSLFLFGMSVMGQSLEKRAGDRLRSLLGKMTTGKIAGLLTGAGVTAVIQSSSATTVMVVGFVNSGLMTLKQAINVIMGANIGTTATAWILSLAGISGSSVFVRLLKPSSFTPLLALIGIILYMFSKNSKKQDTGMILLGFATLMFGMETMSGAVSGLADVPEFTNLFLLFKNPILGVIAGALLTAIIQSSSASVGILQALAITGKISYGAAIPIIMGQNIGTCITAILSSVGANKNAKRAALVHLSFNVIGTGVYLILFCIIKMFVAPVFLDDSATLTGIALIHSVFNILCTMLMLPLSGLLEKTVCRLIKDDKTKVTSSILDERLLITPPIALKRCNEVALMMAQCSVSSYHDSVSSINDYSSDAVQKVMDAEDETDNYEDILGTYLVKLSERQISRSDSNEAAKLLKVIGDFERISDHAVNISESAKELNDKQLKFSDEAQKELNTLFDAVGEITDMTLKVFEDNDDEHTDSAEALEEVVDELKESLRTNHIRRMQKGLCSIETGFVWSDIITNLERISDHCSNIVECIADIHAGSLNLHENTRKIKSGTDNFDTYYRNYKEKYSVADNMEWM